MIGNKTDLNDQRCVTYEDGLSLAEEWRNSGTIVTFIETSAKTGEVSIFIFKPDNIII